MSSVHEIWTEHISKDGRRYFFNHQTNKSQWEKPDELKSDIERKIDATTDWRQYSTAEGKIYYFNVRTKGSVWEKPPEVVKIYQEYERQELSSKDNAKSAFLKWLEEFNFTQRTSWDSATRQLESHERWSKFGMLTKGEKKQLFSEFTSQIHRRTQEEMRRKRSMVGDLIKNEIESWEEVLPHTSYVEFAKRCHKRDWWTWTDEKARDELFQEAMERMEREIKQKERAKRVTAMEKLEHEMEKDANGEVQPWAKVKDKFSGFEGLHILYVLECHRQVFLRLHQLNMKEAEKLAYRAQRKRRQRFAAYLQAAVEKGEIDGRTVYEDFIKPHSKEAVYLDIVGQPGSTPYDLFKEVHQPLRKKYKKERENVKELIAQGILERNAKLDEYERILVQMGVCSKENIPLIYESLNRGSQKSGKRRSHTPEEGEITNAIESISSDESNDDHPGDNEFKPMHNDK
ncbi:pre-mRNA-processing protein prp40 like protein [Babesia gibsoni]|uniref:Pre-mRNA-processing protein prp40 like protein n=1 Tax=Babesia gibsoni TaxID=33632 RepID=A0AAD8LQ44_BABGI|nr:pre-mRNA-processing protein prp40 like protein [Babesia gibsoni]